MGTCNTRPWRQVTISTRIISNPCINHSPAKRSFDLIQQFRCNNKSISTLEGIPKKIISYTFLKSRQMLNQIISPNLSKIVLDASNWAHYLTKYGKMRTLPHKNIKSNKNKPIHRQQTSKHPKWRYKKSKRSQTKIWRWDIENNTVSLHSLGSGDAQEEQEATDPRQRRDHRHWNRRCTSGDADPKTSERDQASKASSFSVLVTVRKYRELSG